MRESHVHGFIWLSQPFIEPFGLIVVFHIDPVFTFNPLTFVSPFIDFRHVYEFPDRQS